MLRSRRAGPAVSGTACCRFWLAAFAVSAASAVLEEERHTLDVRGSLQQLLLQQQCCPWHQH
jgi:hypothetical protein